MENDGGYFKAPETEFLLQWGNRKRLRGPRVKDLEVSEKINGSRTISSRIDRLVVAASDEKETSQFYQPSRFTRNCEGAVLRSIRENNRKSSSPEKEERHYTTRGSTGSGGVGENDTGKISPPADGNGNGIGVEKKRGGVIWPKLYISLTTKEKEEDFMAMKGCKPSHRPKKRPKMIQRSLLMVSPGGWLSDMSYERYEVKEKKTSKKKPRGLKAMGSMESDSE